MKKTKAKPFLLRLPVVVKKEAEKKAEKVDRSLNSWIVQLIKKALRK